MPQILCWSTAWCRTWLLAYDDVRNYLYTFLSSQFKDPQGLRLAMALVMAWVRVMVAGPTRAVAPGITNDRSLFLCLCSTFHWKSLTYVWLHMCDDLGKSCEFSGIVTLGISKWGSSTKQQTPHIDSYTKLGKKLQHELCFDLLFHFMSLLHKTLKLLPSNWGVWIGDGRSSWWEIKIGVILEWGGLW